MSLKPPPRKLLQIVRARNQPLTGKHIPPKVLSHLRRIFILEIARIDRSSPRPHMARNDEVMMDQRNMVVAHGLSHHRRNVRAKRTLQILKLNDRHLRTTRRPERRGVLERSSIGRRHRNLRTSRNNRDKSQSHSQNATIHSATHSSCHLPRSNNSASAFALSSGCHPRRGSAFAFRYPKASALGLSDPRSLKGFSPWGMLSYSRSRIHSSHPKCHRHKTQSNFQSTLDLLTPTIKLTQAPTVRLAPDCRI